MKLNDVFKEKLYNQKQHDNNFLKNKIDLKCILLEMIKESIKKWDKSDIYAISLFVYNFNDNPCEPTVTLGYNTNKKYISEIKNASNEQEAKWNYAFWLQNVEFEFGIDETQAIVKSWLE